MDNLTGSSTDNNRNTEMSVSLIIAEIAGADPIIAISGNYLCQAFGATGIGVGRIS